MTCRYPLNPGWKARDTAQAAAEAIAPAAGSIRAQVYDALKQKPDTPEGVAKRLGLDILTARPRFSELSARNLIEDSGERGPSRSGKSAIVWRVVA